MSLRVDIEKSLENLRNTLHKLDADIKTLEDIVAEHFSLNPRRHQTMQSLERDINKITAKVGDGVKL